MKHGAGRRGKRGARRQDLGFDSLDALRADVAEKAGAVGASVGAPGLW